VRNAVRLVVAQRLVRRLCNCSQPGDVEQDARALGINVDRCWVTGACESCRSTGYRGRALVAEWQTIGNVSSHAAATGDDRLWASATALVETGVTSPQEVVRVLGLRRT
jgi:type IV pilus assembly protein PilB